MSDAQVTQRSLGEDELAERISARLAGPGHLLADDVQILRAVLAVDKTVPDTDIADAVELLSSRGDVRRVFVGTEAHLTAAPAGNLASPTTHDSLEQALFRAQLDLDILHEKLILYRVLMIVALVGGLLLAREWALWLMGV